MADVEVRYETKTITAIRGTEARVVSRWQAEGWELVTRTPGKLRSEIVLRRPRRTIPWRPWIIGGAIVLILVGILVLGILGSRDPSPRVSQEPGVPPATAPMATPSAAVTPTPINQSPEAASSLTPETNVDLAALVRLTDTCDASIAVFAEKYRDQAISFPGNVSAMGLHGASTTRYDMLIGAGDYSTVAAPGPAFQFRDVNTTSDLHFVGPVPDSIGVGDNLDITAKVGTFIADQCLFQLEPVSTTFR
jgi:hypothetical protein